VNSPVISGLAVQNRRHSLFASTIRPDRRKNYLISHDKAPLAPANNTFVAFLFSLLTALARLVSDSEINKNHRRHVNIVLNQYSPHKFSSTSAKKAEMPEPK
jgi:hypothetical protein